MPLRGSNLGTRSRPLSTTTLTPSMVRLVSATFVANTIFREPLGAGSIAARCAFRSRSPYSGHTITSGRLLSSSLRVSATRRISACPGRKTRTLPDCSLMAAKQVSVIRASIRSPGWKGLPQTVETGYIRPSLVTTGASFSTFERRAPSSVADIRSSFSGGSSRSSSRALRHRASARSESRFRRWYSSKMTTPTPSSAGSS